MLMTKISSILWGLDKGLYSNKLIETCYILSFWRQAYWEKKLIFILVRFQSAETLI